MAGIAAVVCGVLVGGTAVATPAFAGTTNATTLTVTGNKTTMTSGKPVAFSALVVPAKVGTTKITGTVDWTVTGHDGTVYPCVTVNPLTSGGKAKCFMDKGVLLAGNAPYVATAVYSGDANFDTSTGSTSLDVTAAPTNVKITLNALPTNGAATVVTVTVVDGPATASITGNVTFTISSQFHQSGVAVRCSGTLTPVLLNNQKELNAQTAECDLPAGWMILPRASINIPKPSNYWSISAVYNGNSSFVTNFKQKSGTARV